MASASADRVVRWNPVPFLTPKNSAYSADGKRSHNAAQVVGVTHGRPRLQRRTRALGP